MDRHSFRVRDVLGAILSAAVWTLLLPHAGQADSLSGVVRFGQAEPTVPPPPPLPAPAGGFDRPGEPAAEPEDDCEQPDDGQDRDERACKPKWSDVPPVRIFPRPGNFTAPPDGPGYYSLHDELAHRWREAPPRFPYPPFGMMPPSFFDADFRYVDDPGAAPQHWADCLKRMRCHEDWLLSTGGQVWWRYMNEKNSRLTGRDNDYHLYRSRVFVDLWHRDAFRVYVEFLDARVFGPDLPPLPIDANHTDFLNAFVDLKLGDIDGSPAYLRIGRQELLLGSQRLVSTLDWANTRRTFQGARAFRQGENFDVDLFWLQPVLPDTRQLDWADPDQNFAGIWGTYRPEPGHFFDLYYLFHNNSSPTTPQGVPLPSFHVSTFGTRYVGDYENWLWDVEAMLQAGDRGGQSILAGAFTAGGGYHFADLPMNPRFWLYYDWASGDHNPGRGKSTTFNQLFPFGHYYLGWIDLVGRQNIHDINAHVFLYPRPWITVWGQYHHFQLDSARDALYSAGGVPLRRDPTGRSGTHVGDELDLVLNFHLGQYTDLMVGYSVLFPGEFLRRTPQLSYVQYSYRW